MSADARGAAPTFLVGIDGSEQSLAAARFTAALAEARGGGVLLASVYPGDEPSGADGLAPVDADHARDQLERVDVPFARRAVHAATSAVRGLHELAEREAAAVVAVGAPHRYGIGRLKPGGVIERLLHGAPVPVLVVGGDAPAAVHTVSVAHAGDAQGDTALSAAVALARGPGTALRIVGVAETEDRRDRERDLVDLVSREAPGAAEARVLGGHAAAALLREGDDADLLVLGSRGYGPPGGVLLGSVARRVVAHARCPVLVVPRTGAEGRAGAM